MQDICFVENLEALIFQLKTVGLQESVTNTVSQFLKWIQLCVLRRRLLTFLLRFQ